MSLKPHPLLRPILICLVATAMLEHCQADENAWRYTTEKPADTWFQVDFDANNWKLGRGGFGTRETPGSRVGTVWNTDDIWLRGSFQLSSVPAKPVLLMHHDEDVKVFINGTKVFEKDGYTTEYELFDISEHRTFCVQETTCWRSIVDRHEAGSSLTHSLAMPNATEAAASKTF
ncbi:MAG: hypothetical protein R3C05_29005 [Pirellulaceae bacterium]